MAKTSKNVPESEETESNPKVYITHLGGHRVDAKELLGNKKVRDLIKQMARIRFGESRRNREIAD